MDTNDWEIVTTCDFPSLLHTNYIAIAPKKKKRKKKKKKKKDSEDLLLRKILHPVTISKWFLVGLWANIATLGPAEPEFSIGK